MNQTTHSPEVFDAIVVGAGATGGWAAKALTEAGFKVLLLEAGPLISEEKLEKRFLPPTDFPLRGRTIADADAQIRPQSRGVLNERNASLFVNETELPYTTPANRPFRWIRGRQVGGKSLTWSRGVYRMTDHEFHAANDDGHEIPWPISYADLKPYYDRVESYVGVCGRNEGNPSHFPDGPYLTPMALTPPELLMKQVAQEKFGRMYSVARLAILTQDYNGKRGIYTKVLRGRIAEAHYASNHTTIRDAAATGNLTLSPDTVVSHLIHTSEKTPKVSGVACVDRQDPTKHFEVRGKIVFLCASTLETTRVLLNSKSSSFPNGIGNTSGVLGHYLMDHTIISPVSSATFPQIRDFRNIKNLSSRIFGGYFPRYRNLGGPDARLKFLRGYHIHTFASLAVPDLAADYPGVGMEMKQLIGKGDVTWRLSASGIGEMLPRFSNFCELNPNLKDKWGIPALHIDCRFSDNELEMTKDKIESLAEVMTAMGGENIVKGKPDITPGVAIHEAGTARMGSDPTNSYLNSWCQSHGVPNLFVTDGACMTSQGHQNPTLTLMALTLRAAEFAIREAKKGNL